MHARSISPVRLAAILLTGLALALPVPAAAVAAAPLEEATLFTADAEADGALSPGEQNAFRKKKDKKEKEEAKKSGGQNGAQKPKEKPFEEAIKDFEVHEGLFTLYTKEHQAFLEIKPDQYDEVYLMTLTRVGGIGQYDPLLGNQQVWNHYIRHKRI